MNHKRLTLIEVMIALVVLGLLTAVLFPAFAAARERRNVATCTDNLHRIYRALQLYRADWDGQLPPTFEYRGWSDRDGKPHLIPPWGRYGLTADNYRCPTSLQSPGAPSYMFRLSLNLDFDDRWSGERSIERTIVPAPESVLASCEAHVRRGNTLPPGMVTGHYEVLRANGSVESIPAAAVRWWGYKNGRWHAPGSEVPDATPVYPNFPREPWPPQFKRQSYRASRFPVAPAS